MRCYLVRYTSKIMPGAHATTRGPVITVSEYHRGNRALLAHEIEHAKQWWIGLLASLVVGAILYGFGGSEGVALSIAAYGIGMHSTAYLAIRPYRQWCEVEAYKKQIAVGNYKDKTFAINALVDMYRLNITRQEAARLLE